jgi:hypothetical protein
MLHVGHDRSAHVGRQEQEPQRIGEGGSRIAMRSPAHRLQSRLPGSPIPTSPSSRPLGRCGPASSPCSSRKEPSRARSRSTLRSTVPAPLCSSIPSSPLGLVLS